MAATINNPHLAGSPIIYTYTGLAVRTGVAFQRLTLSVTVSVNGTNNYTFEFSKPVSGDDIVIDISTAVQGVIDGIQHTASLPDSYNQYGLSAEATEEYMQNGSIQTVALGTTTASGIYAGHYTDAERLGFKTLPAVWSRKPTTSPEVCFIGCPHIVPGQRAPQVDGDPWVAPSATAQIVTAGLNGNVYGISKPTYGYELRFINSLGVYENVFVSGLPTKKVNINSEKIAITRMETFSNFSRGMVLKQNDYEVWTLSSGPLDEAWIGYYIHEVLMARWVWIEVNGNYVPCHILPEETTTKVSCEKSGMMEVEIKVQMDINGEIN